MFQSLLRYREVDKAVANAALSVMRRHMAYLRPETVVLSLASSAVTDPEKETMATALLSQPCTDGDTDGFAPSVDSIPVPPWPNS